MTNEEPEIEKLDLNSMNIVEEKKKELLRLFPEIRTEGGKIDFDKLKLVLGEMIDVGKERYGMNWPGKAECFKTIQTPSYGTLLPKKSLSLDFDNSKNLIIEGDNLEVLKLLQKAYLNKIKFIYIDPPYNTGSDFIYPDDYSENLQTYLEYTNQVDAAGKKYGTNTETDGRFHSKWLSMMMPRLYLARNLLRQDGVIFINIGSEELSNLQLMANEVFGAENCLSIVSRVSKTASNLGTHFADSVDYLLCYAKDINSTPNFKDKVDESLYKKVESDGPKKGEKYRDDVAFYQSSQKDLRPNQKYFIECPDGSKVLPPCSIQDEVMRDGDGRWRWSKETYLHKKEYLVFKETKTSPLVDQNGNQSKWNIYTKSYLSERHEAGTLPRNILTDFINRKGADLLKKFGISFDFAKPIELIIYLLEIVGLDDGDIVLDFFAGSGTTGHSVIEYNIQNKKNLNFILVQLPEKTDIKIENVKIESIFDICVERLKRVLENSKPESIIGYKIFQLSNSNFKTWSQESNSKDGLAKQLELHVDHVKHGRTAEDILYEILLKSGFPLTTKIEPQKFGNQTVYSIAGGMLLVCLEDNITLDLIKYIADQRPERVICLDRGFANNDQIKVNAVQIFKAKGIAKFQTI
jgi:adenine-specific DNA-methyltransferase